MADVCLACSAHRLGGPAGATLYIYGAPFDLVLFGETRLDALVELYYGESDVSVLQRRDQPGADDVVFRYQQ